ncbi:MAG: hypothetical protein ABSH15_04470 [Verrucomicrobiota bacterium]|jgi:hypothetical protein
MNVPFEQRSASLRFYHRRAATNLAAGLTAKGLPRQRRRNMLTIRERKLAARDRSANAAAKRILVNKLNGLTIRGTPRVYAVNRGDAWLLKEHVDNLAASLTLCFHDLPPEAQARALELEKHLSAIRRSTT